VFFFLLLFSLFLIPTTVLLYISLAPNTKFHHLFHPVTRFTNYWEVQPNIEDMNTLKPSS